MAKPTAPLLSFGASGTIAKTQVYASWRGRQYVRRHVIPANPRTTSQMDTRNVFSWLSSLWKEMTTDAQTPWVAFSKGKPLTDRNALNQMNVGPLRTATTLNAMVMSPGSGGGLAALTAVATPGSGQISIAVTAPTPPVGWTVTKAVGMAVRDQDPHTGTLFTTVTAEQAVLPGNVVLTSLAHVEVYQWGLWLLWLKPDGTTAYSTAIRGQATTT